MKQKVLLVAVGLVIGIVGGGLAGYFVGLNAQPISNQGQSITLEGTVICLLHKNTDGPQTLECASGLKTTDGTYYSLSTSPTSASLATAAGSDKRVRVHGIFTPQPSDLYQSEGVITVSNFEFLP